MSCSSRFDGAYFVELKRTTPSPVDGSDYRDDSCQFPADTVIMQRRCHCTFSALPQRISRCARKPRRNGRKAGTGRTRCRNNEVLLRRGHRSAKSAPFPKAGSGRVARAP